MKRLIDIMPVIETLNQTIQNIMKGLAQKMKRFVNVFRIHTDNWNFLGIIFAFLSFFNLRLFKVN